MTRSAPVVGWGVLTGAALAASLAPLPIQLAFAAIAIGGIGMAHGASDLALVPRSGRPVFLLAYGMVAAACLVWWSVAPGAALPLFLLASAIHFAFEDAPRDRPVERVARGVGMIAAPATLHAGALADLLHSAGLSAAATPVAAHVMAIAGGIAAAAMLSLAWTRRDARLLGGTAALLLLPPLIGFSLGFLALHALPQTHVRQRRLGCADTPGYLRATGPVLGAAIVLVVAIGGLMLHHDPSGVRPLFAAIAALAMPHLLVTPWFKAQRTAASRGHGGAIVA